MTFIEVLQEIAKNPNQSFTRIEDGENIDDKHSIYNHMIFKNKTYVLTTKDIFATN